MPLFYGGLCTGDGIRYNFEPKTCLIAKEGLIMFKTVLSAVVVVFGLSAVAVDRDGYYVYRTDANGGSGKWADGTRWVDGEAPTANCKVKVGEEADAPVDDIDMELVSTLSEIWINATNAVLRFQVSNEWHLAAAAHGSGSIVLEAGKSGAVGVLWLDRNTSATAYKTSGGITVKAGALHLPRMAAVSSTDYQYGLLTVEKPGVLYLTEGCPTYAEGLAGDGAVSNLVASGTAESYRYFKLFGGQAEKPYEFSGDLGPNISYLNYGHQYFLRDPDASSRSIRLYSGTIGLTAMARSDGDSISQDLTFNLRGSGSKSLRIRYLGEPGGVSTHSLKMFNDAKDVILDGGPNGGLTVKGSVYGTDSAKQMTRLSFDGDAANACILTVPIWEVDDLSFATYVTKLGGGTWRFAADNNQMNGVLDVRKGVLEYTSLAERGTVCALGYQNILHESYVGAKDDTKAVPYAIRLGDGTGSVTAESATLSYVGAGAASCSTRPIALDGAGRLRNAGTDAFMWSGVTTLGAADGTLVLDGPGTANTISEVTNGAGTVSLVKEGVGTWTVGGNMAISGEVESRGGLLRIDNRRKFTWYRFNVRDTWRDVCEATGQLPKNLDNAVLLRGFALIGEDNASSNVMYGATYKSAANGNPATLLPGEVCYANAANVNGTADRTPDMLFVNSIFQAFESSSKRNIDPDDSNTWVRIAMRLPAGASRIVKYDICAGTNSSDDKVPYCREVKSWSLDGSVDGVTWECLAEEVRDLETPTPLYRSRWYSSNSSATMSGLGMSDQDETAVFSRTVEPDAVGASNGGRLEFLSAVETDELLIDGASPTAGTVANVAFAETGVLRVRNFDRSGDKCLPIVFENVSGLEHLANYSLELNGRASKWRIAVRDGRLYLCPPGVILIVR